MSCSSRSGTRPTPTGRRVASRCSQPRSIWYTAVSGIWQTVWLEPVPETYIAGLKITPDLDAGSVLVEVTAGWQPDSRELLVRVQVLDRGRPVVSGEA